MNDDYDVTKWCGQIACVRCAMIGDPYRDREYTDFTPTTKLEAVCFCRHAAKWVLLGPQASDAAGAYAIVILMRAGDLISKLRDAENRRQTMNIVQPYAYIIDPPYRGGDNEIGINLLRKIEWCGRISHRSEDQQTPGSWRRFIECVVLEHGDWSIVEHASATVDFLVDRGVTHEIVRHRLCSFTQESTRFVNYEKKMPPSFIAPADAAGSDPAGTIWHHAVAHCELAYKDLLEAGCAPQIARSVFPNALASRLIMTCNLRQWRHFFLMRTTKEAPPQMRQVTIPLLADFKACFPAAL